MRSLRRPATEPTIWVLTGEHRVDYSVTRLVRLNLNSVIGIELTFVCYLGPAQPAGY